MKKSYRVKKESDFQRVFETHKSAADLSMKEIKKNLVHALTLAHLFEEK